MIKLPGAHRNLRRRGGRLVVYWQAWRGGPAIGRFEGHTLAEINKSEAEGAAELAEKYAAARRTDVPKDILAGLVCAYKAAPDGYLKLGDDTRAKWVPWLDKITVKFGTLPVVALKAKGMRRQIISWRNEFARTPRTADFAIQVLRRVLSWSVANELAEANPALGIPELYDGDRSGEIVEPEELKAILARATPPAARWFRLAAATGLRRGDLRRLKWSDINATSIELATRKSKGRKRIIVPLLAEARVVLEECRQAQRDAVEESRGMEESPVASIFVMTTAHGKQWAKDSPTGAWIKAAKGSDPAIDKHLHDLRGNFATMLMVEGLSDGQIADIMGWETDDVAQIRRRYVDRDRVSMILAARIDQRQRNGG